MKKRVDFRLVLLLIIAVIFLCSAVQKSAIPIEPAVVEESFIQFDTSEIFDLPVIESDCLEESSLPSRLPVL